MSTLQQLISDVANLERDVYDVAELVIGRVAQYAEPPTTLDGYLARLRYLNCILADVESKVNPPPMVDLDALVDPKTLNGQTAAIRRNVLRLRKAQEAKNR